MTESTGPQTPEEEAALRELAAGHRRRHRLAALLMAVITSTYITVILATTWHDWPLTARDLGFLVFFVCNGLFSTCWMLWGLRQLSADAALERRTQPRNAYGQKTRT
jgi:hypothetical protein